MRSTTPFMAFAITSFCVRKRNDVFAKLKMMLTVSGQTMLCPADTNTKKQSTSFEVLCFFGSPCWARTSDIMINSHALYRLLAIKP